MKSIVGEWISNLAVIAILAALVDMILPSGSIRKYTDFLFGLVILAMFLHPLLLIIGQSPNLETAIFQNSAEQFGKSAAYFSNQAEKSQRDNLENFIRVNLEKDLAFELSNKTGLSIDNVDILFNRFNEELDYSDIQRIEVYASLGQKVHVDPIVIHSDNESYDSKDAAQEEKILEIKEIVSTLYNIKQNQVFVYED